MARDNIRYGVGLGFLQESEEGVETTPRGVEASYNQGNEEELANQFQEGLNEYQIYWTVLEQLASEDFNSDESPITKSDILRVFRTNIRLEGSENTLGAAATTFIQTLEAAGLGEYIVGRRGKESRLEISDDFKDIAGQIIATVDADQEVIEDKEEEQPQHTVESNIGTPRQKDISPIQINLELSGDENPEKVENLIIAVRRGLNRDLRSSGTERFVGIEEGDIEDDEIQENNHSEKVKTERDEESGSDDSDQSLDNFVDSDTDNEGE